MAFGSRKTRWLTVLSIACLGAGPGEPAGPLSPERGGLIDLPHYRSPELEADRPTVDFPDRLESIWRQALEQDDPDLHRQTLQAFAEAYGRGLELASASIEAIHARLADEAAPAGNRELAGRVLIELDHAEAAPALLALLEQADALIAVDELDAALARWDHQPARQQWRERAGDDAGLPALRRSAIEALKQVGDVESLEMLLSLAADGSQRAGVRIAAGEAAGLLDPSRGADQAGELAAGDPTDRRVAAALAGEDERSAGRALLEALADDDRPTVAAAALEALNGQDRALVAALAPERLDHADPNVRAQLLAGLASQRETQTVALVGRLLDDPAPAVRHEAREALQSFAEAADSLREAVEAEVLAQLAQDGGQRWRALEQASLLAMQQDFASAEGLLISLLGHDRAETRLAAATALRSLSLESSLSPALEQLHRLTDLVDGEVAGLDERGGGRQAAGAEATQLIVLIGERRHAPADDVLRRYIPKGSPFLLEARASAVWALGRIHQGGGPAGLAGDLSSRLSDTNPMNPEAESVRRFAAISLGRMQAEDELGTLRRFYDEQESRDIRRACRWAIMRITDEELDPIGHPHRTEDDWFLRPLGG